MTRRDQMIECMDRIEDLQQRLEGHDIWQDQLVWWMAKAICLLLREAAIADRDEVRAPSEPVGELTGRADAQRGAEKVGRWLILPDRAMVCSRCRWITEYYGGLEEEWNFCPCCGAKMEGEEDE